MSANKQQIEFWSGGGGDYWVDKQFEMDTMLNPLGQKAIDSLDIQKGDSILDVGWWNWYYNAFTFRKSRP